MLLDVEDLETSYGASQALFGISLSLKPGEVITLIGRNGMGKTTTVNTIMGLCAPKSGRVRFCGENIFGRAPHYVARLGIGLVPEGRHIFSNLTVRENLLMAFRNIRDVSEPWTCDRVLEIFPRLSERLHHAGNHLSGGEQQMLAIGRALMTNPTLLILDEATEGLAPLIREEIWVQLKALKEAKLSQIVIDKDVRALGELADRHYILEKGKVAWSGTNEDLLKEESIQSRFLAV